MAVSDSGSLMEDRDVQLRNIMEGISVTLVKKRNSSKDSKSLSVPKTPAMDVTSSASLKDSSPSPFPSKAATSLALTFGSAKGIGSSGSPTPGILNSRSLSTSARLPKTVRLMVTARSETTSAVRDPLRNVRRKPFSNVPGRATM